jgi:hypothetical protein
MPHEQTIQVPSPFDDVEARSLGNRACFDVRHRNVLLTLGHSEIDRGVHDEGIYTSRRGVCSSIMLAKDLPTFHRYLLGSPKGEPLVQAFGLTVRLLRFYSLKNARGFSNNQRDPELFLGTFVRQLWEAWPRGKGKPRKVTMLAPLMHHEWITGQIRQIARHVFRSRRGRVGDVFVLRQAFNCCFEFSARGLKIPEPDCWVAFGYVNEGFLPDWVRGRLFSP